MKTQYPANAQNPEVSDRAPIGVSPQTDETLATAQSPDKSAHFNADTALEQPDSVLSMQKTIGNRAVTSLIKRKQQSAQESPENAPDETDDEALETGLPDSASASANGDETPPADGAPNDAENTDAPPDNPQETPTTTAQSPNGDVASEAPPSNTDSNTTPDDGRMSQGITQIKSQGDQAKNQLRQEFEAVAQQMNTKGGGLNLNLNVGGEMNMANPSATPPTESANSSAPTASNNSMSLAENAAPTSAAPTAGPAPSNGGGMIQRSPDRDGPTVPIGGDSSVSQILANIPTLAEPIVGDFQQASDNAKTTIEDDATVEKEGITAEGQTRDEAVRATFALKRTALNQSYSEQKQTVERDYASMDSRLQTMGRTVLNRFHQAIDTALVEGNAAYMGAIALSGIRLLTGGAEIRNLTTTTATTIREAGATRIRSLPADKSAAATPLIQQFTDDLASNIEASLTTNVQDLTQSLRNVTINTDTARRTFNTTCRDLKADALTTVNGEVRQQRLLLQQQRQRALISLGRKHGAMLRQLNGFEFVVINSIRLHTFLERFRVSGGEGLAKAGADDVVNTIGAELPTFLTQVQEMLGDMDINRPQALQTAYENFVQQLVRVPFSQTSFPQYGGGVGDLLGQILPALITLLQTIETEYTTVLDNVETAAKADLASVATDTQTNMDAQLQGWETGADTIYQQFLTEILTPTKTTFSQNAVLPIMTWTNTTVSGAITALSTSLDAIPAGLSGAYDTIVANVPSAPTDDAATETPTDPVTDVLGNMSDTLGDLSNVEYIGDYIEQLGEAVGGLDNLRIPSTRHLRHLSRVGGALGWASDFFSLAEAASEDGVTGLIGEAVNIAVNNGIDAVILYGAATFIGGPAGVVIAFGLITLKDELLGDITLIDPTRSPYYGENWWLNFGILYDPAESFNQSVGSNPWREMIADRLNGPDWAIEYAWAGWNWGQGETSPRINRQYDDIQSAVMWIEQIATYARDYRNSPYITPDQFNDTIAIYVRLLRDTGWQGSDAIIDGIINFHPAAELTTWRSPYQAHVEAGFGPTETSLTGAELWEAKRAASGVIQQLADYISARQHNTRAAEFNAEVARLIGELRGTGWNGSDAELRNLLSAFTRPEWMGAYELIQEAQSGDTSSVNVQQEIMNIVLDNRGWEVAHGEDLDYDAVRAMADFLVNQVHSRHDFYYNTSFTTEQARQILIQQVEVVYGADHPLSLQLRGIDQAATLINDTSLESYNVYADNRLSQLLGERMTGDMNIYNYYQRTTSDVAAAADGAASIIVSGLNMGYQGLSSGGMHTWQEIIDRYIADAQAGFSGVDNLEALLNAIRAEAAANAPR